MKKSKSKALEGVKKGARRLQRNKEFARSIVIFDMFRYIEREPGRRHHHNRIEPIPNPIHGVCVKPMIRYKSFIFTYMHQKRTGTDRSH